jgi:hypothetical protein
VTRANNCCGNFRPSDGRGYRSRQQLVARQSSRFACRCSFLALLRGEDEGEELEYPAFFLR